MVAFLDESILNMRNPFCSWPRKPLQEELFGVHVAGEIFFRNVDRLLGRERLPNHWPISEIHQLCLLRFRGRFSASGIGEVHSDHRQIEEKIRRIRGAVGQLSHHGNMTRLRRFERATPCSVRLHGAQQFLAALPFCCSSLICWHYIQHGKP